MSAKRQSVDRVADSASRLLPATRSPREGLPTPLSDGFQLRIDPRTVIEPISSLNSANDADSTPEPLQDIRAAVLSWGSATIDVSQALELRGQLLKAFPEQLGATTLKNADPQTMVAIESARLAMARIGSAMAFEHWGCVASPTRPGRQKMIQVMEKYRQDGASTVSPQVIPHCSLHSLAGLVAQACGSHGPNLGAGGVPGRQADVFLVGLGWLMAGIVPGVWLVIVEETGTKLSAFTIGLAPANTQTHLRLRPVGSGDPLSIDQLEMSLHTQEKTFLDVGAGYSLELAMAGLE